MRIALVTIAFPKTLEDDPPFRASWELAVEYANQGHEVLILALADDMQTEDVKIESFGKIKVLRKRFDPNTQPGIHVPPLATFFYVLQQSSDLYTASIEALREFKPDVVECQEFNGLGFYFAAKHEFPLVIRCHGPLATLMRAGMVGNVTIANTELVAALELSTLTEADGLISLCHDLVGVLSEQSHIDAGRFRVIRAPYSRLPSQMSAVPVENKITWTKDAFPRLMFWGRISRQKGCGAILESLPLLKEAFPNLELVLVGSEPPEAGEQEPFADHMRSKLKELGLEKNVKFPGVMNRAEIEIVSKEADICLFPSQYETACYSCLEAMSYGACVIASKVGGLAEYVQHGETGWHVPPLDGAALAEAIIHLSKESELRQKLGQAAQRSIAEICSPQRVVSESLEVYDQAINHHRRSAGSRSPAFRIFAEKLSMFMTDWGLVQHIRDLGEEIYGGGWKQGYAEGLAVGKTEGHAQGHADGFAAGQAEGYSLGNKSTSSLLRSIARTIKNRFIGIA